MSTAKNAISRGVSALIVIVVIALILVVVFGAFLNSTLNTSGTTNTSSIGTVSSTTENLTAASYTTVSPSGLKLEININATTFQSSYALGLQISLANTLDQNLSLSTNWSANPTIANWDWNDTLCGLSTVEHTFGYAIFKGHYTESNISKANNQLVLTLPQALSCPNRFYNSAYIQKIEFQPNSYRATLSANSSDAFKAETLNMLINATTQYCGISPNHASGTSYSAVSNTTTFSSGTQLGLSCGLGHGGIDGYWTMPANHTAFYQDFGPNSTLIDHMSNLYQNYFHPLDVNSYTVVAEDIWNQTIFGYFQVIPPSTSAFDKLACDSTGYELVTNATTSVQGSSTFVNETSFLSSSETTFTTSSNVTRSSGYVTTTTDYYPPNSWSVRTCTFGDG